MFILFSNFLRVVDNKEKIVLGDMEFCSEFG